jgi:N-acetylneuraminic acid mutarotase
MLGEPARKPGLVLLSMLCGICGCGPERAAESPPRESGGLVWSRLADLPDRVGVAGSFAGVCGGEGDGPLVVAGGANFPDRLPWEGGTKAWHAAAYVLPAPDAAWRTATPLPRPLGYGVTASHGGRVWCVGGGDATEHVRSTVALEWDAAAERLAVEPDALPPLPEPMAFGAGVVVGSRLYVAGGQTAPTATEALGTFWSIDLAAEAGDRRWREHSGWPGPKRILPVLGALGDKVFLVSGAELVPDEVTAGNGGPGVTRRFLTDAYEFDPTHDAWRPLAPCPVPLVAAPSPALSLDAGRLAFLPGDDGSLFFRQKQLAGSHPGFPRRVHVYDAARNVWTARGTVPDGIRPAVTTPTVAYRGGWIMPTGEVQPGMRSPQIVQIMSDTDGNAAASSETRKR